MLCRQRIVIHGRLRLYFAGRRSHVGRSVEQRVPVAVAVTADGRRVAVPVSPAIFEVSPVAVPWAVGLEVLSLITGSRREPDGRRSGRS
jgi:hypothetical protein